jgi:2-polyprenyl-6-methoxyphenol hydroxylase-like FAD-dependent oxidoreductase
MSYDVIVVGARCAGSPLAMLLARAGHSVLLVDRAAFPSDTMSSHWLLRPGVELLATWGLLDPLVASGCPPIERLTIGFDDLELSGVPLAGDGPATTYAPRRTILDAQLLDAAREAGAEVREGVTVRDVLWEDGAVAGVIGQDTAGRTWVARARLVVGADGRSSTIARAVGAEAVEDHGALAATAYAYWAGLPVDGARTRIRPGLGISRWPTHDDLTVVALTCPRAEFRAGRGAERTYLRLLEGSDLAAPMRSARRVGPVRAAPNLRNFSRRSHGPGWALAGDAGHHMDPIGARGISDAFADADNLASSIHTGLAGSVALDRALSRYQARRDLTRAALFRFTCEQASLRPVDTARRHLLHAVHRDPAATADLLGVFAGSRRVEDFFAPANVSRVLGQAAS